MAGIFYGVTKAFEHNKTDEWLGVAVDVSPRNDRFTVSLLTTLYTHLHMYSLLFLLVMTHEF